MIYIESQYFIGSGKNWGRGSVSNRVPETIVNRTIEKIKANEPFHTYVVLPMFPEGDPSTSGITGVRSFQWSTIKYMINALGDKWQDYLSFYFLAQWSQVPNLYNPKQVTKRMERVNAGQRYMIYVHSKLMIVDDKYVILGSANLNERSLAGNRDSEICVSLWSDREGDPEINEQQAMLDIAWFRKRLWAEHLGKGWYDKLGDGDFAEIFTHPGSLECVKAVRDMGRSNFKSFLNGQRTGLEGHLMQWPVEVGAKGELTFSDLDFKDDRTLYIPDYDESSKADYKWIPSGSGFFSYVTDAQE